MAMMAGAQFVLSSVYDEAMIRNAADENGPHKVRFNAIRPGFVATEIIKAMPEKVLQGMVAHTPMGRIGCASWTPVSSVTVWSPYWNVFVTGFTIFLQFFI